MMFNLPGLLGTLYAASEIGLSIFKRAKSGDTKNEDRGSLILLWIVIAVSIAVAFQAAFSLPAANLGALKAPARYAGIVCYVVGLTLRWYSIVILGKFFTVNVAIAADHRLIDTGPYRYLRHPSYSGALLAFLGLGLCLGNWISILLLLVPIFLVFLRRMNVEESALLQGLGESYRDYMRRTKRLIPAIY
jgi:protein-S-isoprenylcysteine O-methyltransferase